MVLAWVQKNTIIGTNDPVPEGSDEKKVVDSNGPGKFTLSTIHLSTHFIVSIYLQTMRSLVVRPLVVNPLVVGPLVVRLLVVGPLGKQKKW